jgi:ABC-type branched-subunit amino acid transport system substrate-binding protein
LRVRLRVGAPVPMSGRYRIQGAEVRTGLEAWAREHGAALVLRDDRSSPEIAARLHGQLAGSCRFVLGPYGGDSMRAVAELCSGSVVWNHGAAADDVQRLPGVVSVPSPASSYLVALACVLPQFCRDPAVCLLTAAGSFPVHARRGLEAVAPGLGLRLVAEPAAADVLLLCGPLRWEVERIRRLRRPGLLIGGVSPGIARFPEVLGDDPDGLLAPVQWHHQLRLRARLGPASVDLPDYVGAQAYAAALIAERCLQLAPDDPLTAAKQLETVTFFGGFRLAGDGLQVGHQMAVIRWRNNRRELQSAALRMK